MKLMICVVILCLLSPLVAIGAGCRDNLQPNSTIEKVGYYKNTAPHSYRFHNKGEDNGPAYYMNIELWRANDCFFGRFRATQGQEGDPSFGHIDDFTYDQKTTKFNFQSKLSLGMTGDNRPSKDLFDLAGTFNYKQFSATVTITSKLEENLNVPAEKQKTVFKLVSGKKPETSNYGEWLKSADEPKWLGPKW